MSTIDTTSPRVTSPSTARRSTITGTLAAVLLALMFVLAGGAALRESVTIDEVAHIGAGLSYINKLDLRMNAEHPPLAKLLSGVPLALRGTYADYSHISWTFSDRFFTGYMGQWVFGEWVLTRWNDTKRTLAWARLPMLLLTLLLGWLIYIYGSQLGGAWGGLIALSLYTSAPVFLTFGPLVLTDVAVTLFTILTLWTFADVLVEPSRRNVARLAAALAGAFLSKFSAPILVAALLTILLSTRWWPIAGQPDRRWRRLRYRATAKALLWAALIVYGVYFVFSWNQPVELLDRLGTGPVARAAERLLMPPWLYLRGLGFVLLTSSRPTFLFGHIYRHGIPIYFPVVLFFKSSIGFLGLLGLTAALAIAVRFGRRGDRVVVPESLRPHWRVLWVGLLVFTAACMLSRMTISLRHFTVPIAILILTTALLPRLIAQLSDVNRSVGRAFGITAFVLAVSSVATTVRAYPYYFPYVNAFSLGSPAYRLFSDSNVDWNQALPDVARFANERDLTEINVDMYGFSDPNFVIPQAHVWDCQDAAAGDAGKWAVVSANLILDTHNCEWLTHYPMQPLAGGSMYAVRLPSPIPVAGSAGGPPIAAQRRIIWGLPFDVRTPSLEVSRHPHRLPAVYAEVIKRFSSGAAP